MQSIRSSGGLVWCFIFVVVHGEDYIDNFHRQALQDVHSASSPAAASEQVLVHGGMDVTRIGTTSSGNSSNSSSKGSAGVNVLAVMLVTASSVMVFLVLRLSLCQCNTSAQTDNNSNGASGGGIETTTATTTFDERKNGLGQDDIDKFTVLVDYSSLLGSMENGRSCTVCLSEFAAEDNKIRILPACNHSFHTECIDLWLFSHMSCPLCRGSLVPTSAPGVVEAPMLVSTTDHAQASAQAVNLEDPLASAADDAEGNHLVVDIK